MRALVTGCNGQVGYCLATLLADDDNVTLLAVDKEALDITNQDQVIEVVNDFKPDIIINAAAYTAVDNAEQQVELAYAINRDGPKFLAEAAQNIGAAILHISTDYVFEGNKSTEYNELDITNPQSIYGASKLEGEIAVAKVCEKHIILRTAWVFGEHGNNFVKTMLRIGARSDELNIVGDQYGGPTYAGDIAIILIDIAKRISNHDFVEYGIYHYSGLPHVSWYEFADLIFNNAVAAGVISRKPKLHRIPTEQYLTPAKRPSNSRLSTCKITDNMGFIASDWQMALTNIEAFME
ncbi:dTDP-4-dehydrorhamnose reductase [Shewanella sp. NIFS-20-20]|uniref:dTDP-4-dehydrorhamnose reductase n=1 Tax=Shewanella sp. NIFS-20-20 TaxID=2853806 RepID=UPI001C482D26|nr:dTDP-4-dehydrorhamnose reductase [Shewanella sp. NIFS-20-20]MBV7314828.1 dTDP-4-dehydrorhamnose reductase [Shewanella sp. NIFS-20-20]